MAGINLPIAGVNLRDEALKFVSHVRQTQSPAYFVPAAQNLTVPAGQDLTEEERLYMTELVRDRFSPEEDSHNTPAELLEIMSAVEDGEMPKPEAYAKGCILLIGHADLFLWFERFLNDGEVGSWRLKVREKFMREMDALVERCRSTIRTIKEAPENLTPDHLDCIERLVFSEIDDPVKRGGTVDALKLEDPCRYPGRCVLRDLEEKLDVLLQMFKFLKEYFNDVLVLAGVEL